MSPSWAIAPVPTIRSFFWSVVGGAPDGTFTVGSVESAPVFGVTIVGGAGGATNCSGCAFDGAGTM